ncbi:MAG: hypothetical protein Q7S50_00460 [bacterium]|nr:hypothetical protein [bacterium]
MPLRARRRRRYALIAFAALILIVVAVYGVSFISYLPRYTIQSISIEGAREVPEELIRRYTETILNDGSYTILSRENIFLYSRTEIEKGLESFLPRIESAHVVAQSVLSTDLHIVVEEREPYALWCLVEGGACYLMDKNGFIFSAMASSSPGERTTQYIFGGSILSSTDSTGSQQVNPIGQKFIPAHLPGLLSLLEILGQSGFEPKGAVVDNDQDFFVSLRKGFTLKASFGQDTNTLTKNLELVLSSDALRGKEKSIEYIDLRFGNRVYYKLKGEAEVSNTRP